VKPDEIRRRVAEVRRAKERAGEPRHDPQVAAEVLRRVAAQAGEGALRPRRGEGSAPARGAFRAL